MFFSRGIAMLGMLLAALPAAASAQMGKPRLDLKVSGIEDGKPVPGRFAYCVPDPGGKSRDGANLNPALRWYGAPLETKSYAVIVVDRDVPVSFDTANQEGRSLPRDMQRRDFYHWVLVDVPPGVTEIKEGEDSNGKPEGGKPTGAVPYGVTGRNDFAEVFKGSFGGYDGPCPPWNDERLHHYHFKVYALDVPTLGLSGDFTGEQAMQAIAPHALAVGEVVGTYTQHPKLMR